MWPELNEPFSLIMGCFGDRKVLNYIYIYNIPPINPLDRKVMLIGHF